MSEVVLLITIRLMTGDVAPAYDLIEYPMPRIGSNAHTLETCWALRDILMTAVRAAAETDDRTVEAVNCAYVEMAR